MPSLVYPSGSKLSAIVKCMIIPKLVRSQFSILYKKGAKRKFPQRKLNITKILQRTAFLTDKSLNRPASPPFLPNNEINRNNAAIFHPALFLNDGPHQTTPVLCHDHRESSHHWMTLLMVSDELLVHGDCEKTPSGQIHRYDYVHVYYHENGRVHERMSAHQCEVISTVVERRVELTIH